MSNAKADRAKRKYYKKDKTDKSLFCTQANSKFANGFDFRYVSMIESAFSVASALQFMLSVMVLCLIGIQFLSVGTRKFCD